VLTQVFGIDSLTHFESTALSRGESVRCGAFISRSVTGEGSRSWLGINPSSDLRLAHESAGESDALAKGEGSPSEED